MATATPESYWADSDPKSAPKRQAFAGQVGDFRTCYDAMLRAAGTMFQPEELERLAPRQRGGPSLAARNGEGAEGLDPVAVTEAIAYDFLARGGKHSRPFITLAVYDALTGGGCTQADGAANLARLPDAIKRCALSIETFHKASLVHDDIEDDDQYRYGAPTLHRKFGTPTAINVGDYLIGLGYRLVCREAQTLGAEVVAEIVERLADAHMKLSEGQGAELIWRDSRNKQITPPEAINIYALKTAPAFGAALFMGARLAGSAENYAEPMNQFARHLGVAFQIINDLNDWLGDDHNKLAAAGDVIGGRPTVLWALALEGLKPPARIRLELLAAEQPLSNETLRQIRSLYDEADVFEKASRLVAKHQRRAEAMADEIQSDLLRRLFYYLIDTVLERRQCEPPKQAILPAQSDLVGS